MKHGGIRARSLPSRRSLLVTWSHRLANPSTGLRGPSRRYTRSSRSGWIVTEGVSLGYLAGWFWSSEIFRVTYLRTVCGLTGCRTATADVESSDIASASHRLGLLGVASESGCSVDLPTTSLALSGYLDLKARTTWMYPPLRHQIEVIIQSWLWQRFTVF